MSDMSQKGSRWRRFMHADGPTRNYVASTRVEIAHFGIGLALSKGRVTSARESCKVSSSSLNKGVALS